MKHWPTKPLRELCEVFTDGDWVESKDQSSDGIRLIQTGNVGKGVFKDRAEKARYISEATFERLRCTEIFKGDCLISRLPDPVGRSCIVPETGERMITAVDCSIVRFKSNVLLAEFFNLYSQSGDYINAVAKECTGTTRNRISRKNLELIPIPVPPLAQQQRIVSLLAEAADLQKLRAQADHRTASLIPALFHEMFGDPTKNPKNWPIKTLEDLFDITSSKRVFERDWKSCGVPFYRTRELVKLAADGHVDNELFISEEMYRDYSAKYGAPKEGDIMVSGVGTLGICYVVKHGDKFYFKDGNIIWLKKKTDANSLFIEAAFQTDFVQNQIHNNSAGATVGTYTIVRANKTRIPVPPLALQNEFAQRVTEICTLETAQAKSRERLEALFQSLLHRAFNGDL